MPRERERKFLVAEPPARLSRHPHELIEQGYLAVERGARGAAEVRLRKTKSKAVLTVKRGGRSDREEREVEISREVARALWPLTQGRRLAKVRYKIPFGAMTIELDVYHGALRGLVVAEVEFKSVAEMRRFIPPTWFAREVTGRRAYSNSALATSGLPAAKRGV